MDWLPIESAPKDGTRILIARPGYVGEASWIRFDGSEDSYAREGWVGRGLTSWTGSDAPTVWQPIPAPPNA